MTENRKILLDKLNYFLRTLKDPNTRAPFGAHRLPQIAISHQTLSVILTVPQNQEHSYQTLQKEIQKAAELLVRECNEKLKVSVILTNENPLPFRHIIAIASGKGGVGKSTTAMGLAYALSHQGLKVGLLDADIYGPSLPILLGQQAKPQLDEHRLMIPVEKDGIQFFSMGFLLENDKPIIWRGPLVSQSVQQFLKGVAWAQRDILLIDLPPGTGDIQLTLIQKARLSGAIIVSTPQDMALIDARKAIAMFDKAQVPIVGIVENMSYFLCPHCEGRSDIFEHGGAQKVAHELQIPFLGAIPLDLGIRRSCDEGNPQKLLSIAGEPYHLLAQQVVSSLAKPSPRDNLLMSA